MNSERIPIRGRAYYDRGEWNVLIEGPSWLTAMIGERGSGRRMMRVHNWGGSCGSNEGSVLIGTADSEDFIDRLRQEIHDLRKRNRKLEKKLERRR